LKLSFNRKKKSGRIEMVSYSSAILGLVLVGALTLLFIDSSTAFGQETTERYLSARVEIWALFYRLMVIAFVIGAVVMGTMTYVVWRFRESHPKNRGDITPATRGAHR
jgi:heme/copper-type cytochrome/quinol oxidase subunit 2